MRARRIRDSSKAHSVRVRLSTRISPLQLILVWTQNRDLRIADLVTSASRDTAHRGPQLGQQHVKGEWLRQIIVGSRVQPIDDVAHGVT